MWSSAPDCQFEQHKETQGVEGGQGSFFFFFFSQKFKGRTAVRFMFPHTHIGVKYQPVQYLAAITTDDFLLTEFPHSIQSPLPLHRFSYAHYT